jgi:hypothetical protein
MRQWNPGALKSSTTVLGAATLLFLCMPLSAAEESSKFINVSTQLCLDSNGEGKVYTLACNGGNYQNWTVSGQRLINVSTQLCLDSNGEGKVYTLACNGGNYQNWIISGQRLINNVTRRCLDSNAERSVYTLKCNGGNYQNWESPLTTPRVVSAERTQPGNPQQNRAAFRDWDGRWDLKFEFQGQWHSAQMIIKATDSGIRASYDFGRLEGAFDGGDVSTATGQIENTTATGTTCSSGKQTGSFSMTLAVNGRSMTGWWDVCSAGPKYRWKAAKRG